MKKNLLFVFALFLSVGVFAQDYMKNMVALYNFEDDLTDATDNKNDLTEEGGTATYATGKYGKAVEFKADYDGNDTLALLTPEGIFDPSKGSCAFSAWIFLDNALADLGYNPVIAQGLGKNGVSFEGNTNSANIANYVTGKGEFRAYFGNFATKAVVPEPQLGNWHHLAVTFCIDGTKEDSVLKMYVDGSLVVSVDFVEKQKKVNITDSIVAIGKHAYNYKKHFYGKIDQIAFFSDSLGADDVKSIFDNGIKTGGSSSTGAVVAGSEISVYPIPSNGTLNIELDDYAYAELFDVSGSLVKVSNESKMNIEALSKGTYILKVYNQKGSAFVQKVVY